MTQVLLIYPYFKPRWDRSVFRFPPLGVGYIASSLRQAGHDVRVLDCTFLRRKDALVSAKRIGAPVVGIYCMATMAEDCLWLAGELRATSRLLIAGGPLPTCDPDSFLGLFDVVVVGEGEQTATELLLAYEQNGAYESVPGIARRRDRAASKGTGVETVFTAPRPNIRDLDGVPFPARDLLPNRDYIRYGKRAYGYSITTVMSTRGCPFRCDFCSNVVFGGSYRERSAENVVDEIQAALGLGYDQISFGDDVFTLRRERVWKTCAEIRRRGLSFSWECLGRVDALDEDTAREMKASGCRRIYFGIESGNDQILEGMNKRITKDQAQQAVVAAHRAGLEVGAFFILFYPGETDATVLETLHFAAALPVDYLGLTLPYPLPGTALFERTREQITRSWKPGENIFFSHQLTYRSDFSEPKMQFGLAKGKIQFLLRRNSKTLSPIPYRFFEKITDGLLVRMK
jgi:anaerobic magnesium-protoporphyrin IX monomethyl ester cyclase